MSNKQRLFFLDALRAFAILMMLQGHFISGVLAEEFKQPDNSIYRFWLYCRGFTAPVFFTITGWIVTFLLLQNPIQGWKNPRIKKGLKRVAELLFWGYLLRLNLPMLFKGKLNASFIYPDVLQIIALGLLFVLLLYALLYKLKLWNGLVFLCLGCTIFLLQPCYVDKTFETLPKFIAAYLTKANNGVFYVFPWLGYVCIGASIAYLFKLRSSKLWPWGIYFMVTGWLLIHHSSSFFIDLSKYFTIDLFRAVAYNNFLFIRLGDVFMLIGFFILLNPFLHKGKWMLIGTKTLDLYIIHYFILYGSLFGIGLYKYYKYSFNLQNSILGTIGFVLVCVLCLYGWDSIKKKAQSFNSRFVIKKHA